jgi:hypothetical protein
MTKFIEVFSYNSQRETASKVYVNVDAVRYIRPAEPSESNGERAVIVFDSDLKMTIDESTDHLASRLEFHAYT